MGNIFHVHFHATGNCLWAGGHVHSLVRHSTEGSRLYVNVMSATHSAGANGLLPSKTHMISELYSYWTKACTWQTDELPLTSDTGAKNANVTCFPRRETQWNKCFVSSLSLTCGGISPLPLWEVVQKQTATEQDVVTLSLHYLQPTSQTADHNKCLSYHSPIYLWFLCLLSSCVTA